jgi:hypothetical protein
VGDRPGLLDSGVPQTLVFISRILGSLKLRYRMIFAFVHYRIDRLREKERMLFLLRLTPQALSLTVPSQGKRQKPSRLPECGFLVTIPTRRSCNTLSYMPFSRSQHILLDI